MRPGVRSYCHTGRRQSNNGEHRCRHEETHLVALVSLRSGDVTLVGGRGEASRDQLLVVNVRLSKTKSSTSSLSMIESIVKEAGQIYPSEV